VNEVQRKADEQAAMRIAEIIDLAAKIDGADAIGLNTHDANRFISKNPSPHHPPSSSLPPPLPFLPVISISPTVRIGEVRRVKEKTGKEKQRTMLLFNSLIVLLEQKKELKKTSKYLFNIDWYAKMGDVTIVDVADAPDTGTAPPPPDPDPSPLFFVSSSAPSSFLSSFFNVYSQIIFVV